MRSILNTIPIAEPFMFQRQGYNSVADVGCPVADGNNLLPFYSYPIQNPVTTTITGTLVSLCGTKIQQIGLLKTNITNGNLTAYWPVNKSVGFDIRPGYYYVECSIVTGSDEAVEILNDYIQRVADDNGSGEGASCVLGSINNYLGESGLDIGFKTEPFYVPSETLKGTPITNELEDDDDTSNPEESVQW